jgi:hypothetical protein
MEKQWEHKIKEAFQKKDESFTYEKKEELWNRISGYVGQTKGVATFWRVAAIFLALIAFSGSFAAFSTYQKQFEKIETVEAQNSKLKFIVDSSQNIEPEIITEIKFIEKEKIVYREVEQSSTGNNDSEIQIKNLENKIFQLNQVIESTSFELQTTRDSLDFAYAEMENSKTDSKNKTEIKTSNFKLKTERVQNQLQPVIIESPPKMKVQLLKIQDSNINFDMNSTLLKK